MNQIEALQALVENKKIRKKHWKKEHFLEFNSNRELVNESGFSDEEDSYEFTVWVKNDLTLDEWELYIDILTSEEKEYLEYVLKPFKDKIEYIKKLDNKICRESIFVKMEHNCMCFPDFVNETYYRGMEVNKKYTLEELGLFGGE